jgi:hypothetical protein
MFPLYSQTRAGKMVWRKGHRLVVDPGTIRNFVHGGAGYHLGGCLHETLTEHDGELGLGC